MVEVTNMRKNRVTDESVMADTVGSSSHGMEVSESKLQ